MDRDNEAAIWGNDKRESDRHPTHKGNATIDGVEYWVSAWARDKDANPKSPALKLKFTRKEERSQPAPAVEDDGGAIPF